MVFGNEGDEILPSEILKFQEALLQNISASEFGISITKANSIIIGEHEKMHPTKKRLDISRAVMMREKIIENGTIGIGSEFVEVENGKFKPLVILS